MAFNFIQTRNTRSGREYGQVQVIPVAFPPDFALSQALKRAISLDTDEVCFHMDDPQQQAGLIEDAWWTRSTSDHLTQGPSDIVPSSLSPGNVDSVGGNSGGDSGPFAEGTAGSEPLEEGEIVESSSGGHVARKHHYRQSQKAKRFKAYGHIPNARNLHKHVGMSAPITADVNLPKLPFTKCGYQSVNLPKSQCEPIKVLDELVGEGYCVVKHIPSCSQPIVDLVTHKVVGVVVAMPDDPSYAESAQLAFEAIDRAGVEVLPALTATESKHRRGGFAAVHYGVSYGQGSRRPHWLRCKHEAVVKNLLANEHLVQLASFASYAFATWAPKVYGYYSSSLCKLSDAMPHLQWGFWKSIFLCTTFNFGPQACCKPHHESLNLPFGWCAITALGNFDYTTGGHLVLHDLRLLIEFPPGSLILIPSALLTHSNTPIQPGEKRISLTQYSAGGVFRYVENRFMCESDLKTANPLRYAEAQQAKKERAQFGLGLWSALEELLEPAASTLTAPPLLLESLKL